MLSYLGTDAAREGGILALATLSGPTEVLAGQLKKAEEALRILVLVYMAHCAIFILILGPVSIKLTRLLNAKIANLVRMKYITSLITASERWKSVGLQKTSFAWAVGWKGMPQKLS